MEIRAGRRGKQGRARRRRGGRLDGGGAPGVRHKTRRAALPTMPTGAVAPAPRLRRLLALAKRVTRGRGGRSGEVGVGVVLRVTEGDASPRTAGEGY